MDNNGVSAPPVAFRCFGNGNEIYERYHDREWGRPIVEEHGLFERLCLESFQSGLSWLVILRKRDGFRDAFAHFDPGVVADFGAPKIEELLANTAIVRNRAKIEATIANARATLGLSRQGLTLRELLWGLRPDEDGAPAQNLQDLPSFTVATTELARQMKRLGFRFLGPTTLYYALQACGIVNDHLAACPVRAQVQALRSSVGPQPGSEELH